jgi:hemolysin activation/secretion protein
MSTHIHCVPKIDHPKGKKVKHFFILALGTVFILSGSSSAFAAIPTGQDVGSRVQVERREKEQKAISEKLAEDQGPVVEGEEKIQVETPSAPASQAKVTVDKIEVAGVTLINKEKVRRIVAPFEGKELALSDFQTVTAAITDEYRSNGYVTSFAFIPPQMVEQKVLKIAVNEGKIGDVKISGNKWFGTDFLLRHVDARRGETFNYDVLRENIRHLNERPDVNGRVVLSRGEEAGETDVNVQVQDHFPWHATVGYNNYNSAFLERNKGSVELRSTNFTGNGDILAGEVQIGEADRYQLYSGRYIYPISRRLNYGVYYIHVNQALGRSIGSQRITGEGDVVNSFLTYKIFDKENFSLSFNPAFEYKDFTNKVAGVVAGEDKVRVAKLGFDVDFNDAFRGRNLITQEFDFGIPDFLDGLEEKDDSGSRPGSAGQFVRSVTNMARVQAMPYSTVLLLKSSMQLCHYNLPSSEQFQIGGFYSVRGYPVSEFAGDSGITGSAELHIPPYLVPQTVLIPATKRSLRESLTLFGFYDFGYVSNNSPRPGEIKEESLDSAGFGFRFNLGADASVSFDYGFALGQKASDGSKSAGYIETKLFF